MLDDEVKEQEGQQMLESLERMQMEELEVNTQYQNPLEHTTYHKTLITKGGDVKSLFFGEK